MHNYQHQFLDGSHFPYALGKIVCVGRNYADHAKELNNPIPKTPLLFIKPATAAITMDQPITIPAGLGACHHELEMAILIGRELSAAQETDCLAAIAGVGLGIDLTLRDVQSALKEKGQPWERAKAFDGSCPLSQFVEVGDRDIQQLDLKLWRNSELQQQGNTRDMLFSVSHLLGEISQCFTLLPGDVVMTGTPAGVGPLMPGDHLKLELADLLQLETTVA
jgi:2-keto-4-pentenoate hydratase/2-oxohepta-3-ene-1,7-dioic acid hydratase in catechol pathway